MYTHEWYLLQNHQQNQLMSYFSQQKESDTSFDHDYDSLIQICLEQLSLLQQIARAEGKSQEDIEKYFETIAKQEMQFYLFPVQEGQLTNHDHLISIQNPHPFSEPDANVGFIGSIKNLHSPTQVVAPDINVGLKGPESGKANAHTSKYQGVSYCRGDNHKSKPWLVICRPLINKNFYETEDQAAFAIRDAVDTHLKEGNELPRSLHSCDQEGGTGYYLRVDKEALDLRLAFANRKPIYQCVSYQGDTHRFKPYRVRCAPLICDQFYETEEAAALAIREAAYKHLSEGKKLPRSLSKCPQSDDGLYLKEIKNARDVPKSIYQGVSHQGGTHKSLPWRAFCTSIIEGKHFKTDKEAAWALKTAVDNHLEKAKNYLARYAAASKMGMVYI